MAWSSRSLAGVLFVRTATTATGWVLDGEEPRGFAHALLQTLSS